MTFLETILEHKCLEVQQRKKAVPADLLKDTPGFQAERRSFKQALLKPSASGIIAEIKRKSPSRGVINECVQVPALACGYQQAGATAISVLTDSAFFGGSLDDLSAARQACALPLLRKDFIIDEYQIIEARAYGADLVLLIAAALQSEQVRGLSSFAQSIGLEVLLEVHSEAELENSRCASVDIIGVNNRDLHTFSVSVELSCRLAGLFPAGLVPITESGIDSPETVKRLREMGYKGFLIGETFMKTSEPACACRSFIEQLGGKQP